MLTEFERPGPGLNGVPQMAFATALLQLPEPPEPLHAIDLPFGVPPQCSFAAAFAYCTGIILTVTTATADVRRAKLQSRLQHL